MNQLVSATFARNNFSDLIDQVVNKDMSFILVRKSQPQAAIVPYQDLVAKEENWQKEFNKQLKKTQPYFNSWLKQQNIKKKDLTEEKLYELIDQAAGRT
ncbi:MAG: type II toxin-antitoxin system Phd/YefM family antitoxin [Candidatus Beckwithbacteria bacterium]|nr:type II toxin-antitoxin system Phd/YefM family antitoxin [Patescibacteria group bacterium]